MIDWCSIKVKPVSASEVSGKPVRISATQLIGWEMCVMCVQGIPYGRIMETLERGFPLDRVCQARQLNGYLQILFDNVNPFRHDGLSFSSNSFKQN